MKIKHFAGYGCVNARKVGQDTYLPYTKTIVEVWGNHEVGLKRPFKDIYCIEKWLGRFIPKGQQLKDYFNGNVGTIDVNGEKTDYIVYILLSK